MTVGTKLHQCLASLRSEAGNLESFALETQDKQAKQMYHQFSQQLSQIVSQLESRVNYVEQEEPTYKISSSTQQGGGMNMGIQNTMGNTKGTTPMNTATNFTGKNKIR